MSPDLQKRCEDSMKRLERYCERCYGVKMTDLEVTTKAYDSERDRWDAWAASQIHWAAKELLHADSTLYGVHQAMKYAFRGLMLAREYQGRRGGFLSPPIDEELTNLRNVFESLVEERR